MSTDSNTPEQRHFSRIAFDAPARLICEQDEQRWTTTVLDVSLKGVLLARPNGWNGYRGQRCIVEIQLLGAEEQIRMETLVAHVEDTHIGFDCHHLDIDSASHLHRLVELNLGDETLLQRELAEMVSATTPPTRPPNG